jgi:hypothetical protein
MVQVKVFQQGKLLPLRRCWLSGMMMLVHIGLIKICKKMNMTPA